MDFVKGNIDRIAERMCALMSAHFAAQSVDETACAVMSEHWAQGSSRTVSASIFFRY